MLPFQDIIKGRGAQINTVNVFAQQIPVKEHWEAIDEIEQEQAPTKYIEVFPKTIVNKVDSPDVGMEYSMNPYQGCEHGCVYCYARNSHQYWGYNAGLEFEQMVLVKKNAPQLLEKLFQKPNWEVKPIMMSGNTDCYQPVERKLQITRKCLEVFDKYKHPVGIITKNSLVQRDIDILQSLNEHKLTSVCMSINTLNEELRMKLEPRTATIKKRIEMVELLAKNGIPVYVLMAPIIPGLNNHEVMQLAKAVSEAGAKGFGHIVVRLNGSIAEIFANWIETAFPEKAKKVLNQVAALHGGKLNDSRFSTRMKGDGKLAESIASMVKLAKNKYFPEPFNQTLNCQAFIRNNPKGQLTLF
ncbi:MAG: PA0069 family radical SAM protein [Chitinophagales bacterium]|nr:PA0069 family radical SAM protein [Chitinophagales bacterium]